MTLLQKIELLGSLLTRTGLNPIEIDWANNLLSQLRILAAEAMERAEAEKAKLETVAEADNDDEATI